MRARELACGFWLRNLALLWQRFKDASGRIKRQPTEQRYLTDSSTLLRTKNSRIKRGPLIRTLAYVQVRFADHPQVCQTTEYKGVYRTDSEPLTPLLVTLLCRPRNAPELQRRRGPS